MLAKLTAKNQISLPKVVAEEFPGVEYFDVSVRGREIVLAPAEVVAAGSRARRLRAKMKHLGLDETVVEEAVRWARERGK